MATPAATDKAIIRAAEYARPTIAERLVLRETEKGSE